MVFVLFFNARNTPPLLGIKLSRKFWLAVFMRMHK